MRVKASFAMSKKVLFLPVFLLVLGAGCDEAALQNVPSTLTATEPVGGLSPEQAARVVARVGDRNITLGDFARTLDRMDPFDRLRYQTKERRRELLQEIIDVELLAQEARRRGLDKRPDVADAIRQLYRDALLSKLRDSLPMPAAIPAEEVKAYYDANAEKFNEPERRRVSAIVLSNKADVDKVLKLAVATKNATEWGQLFLAHSINAPKTKRPNDPVDLAGDLGLVGPPGDAKGANTKVPEAVREVAFKLPAVGAVHASAVELEGKFFVVRLSGVTAGHKRTVQEADRTIRVAILQGRLQELERKLDQDLRAKFKVELNDKALADIKLPSALVDAATAPNPYPYPMGTGAPTGSASSEDAPPSSNAPPSPSAPPIKAPGDRKDEAP